MSVKNIGFGLMVAEIAQIISGAAPSASERLRRAMLYAQDEHSNWMCLEEEDLFLAAIGAVYLDKMTASTDKQTIEYECLVMRSLAAAGKRVPVDFSALAAMKPEGYEALGLQAMWNEIKAKKNMREVAPVLDALAKMTQEKIKI